jgi:hypothetical protein
MRKLLCFHIVVFGCYYAGPSMRMYIRSGGLCLLCYASRPSCACIFEVAGCSTCCVMLRVPLAHVYSKWRVVLSACCVMLRVPLAHVYSKWRVALPVVSCCASLLRMYIRSGGLFCLLRYAARPSCACIFEVAGCSTCCVMLCVPLIIYNL